VNTIESGVRFAAHPDTAVEVDSTFLRSEAGQLRTVFVGVEPAVLIQPEYDADSNTVTLILTACDLDPAGLLELLATLADAAEQMVAQQVEMGLVSPLETTD
jgi:hypothetical protein